MSVVSFFDSSAKAISKSTAIGESPPLSVFSTDLRCLKSELVSEAWSNYLPYGVYSRGQYSSPLLALSYLTISLRCSAGCDLAFVKSRLKRAKTFDWTNQRDETKLNNSTSSGGTYLMELKEVLEVGFKLGARLLTECITLRQIGQG